MLTPHQAIWSPHFNCYQESRILCHTHLRRNIEMSLGFEPIVQVSFLVSRECAEYVKTN